MGKTRYQYECVLCQSKVIYEDKLKCCQDEVVCDDCLAQIELDAENEVIEEFNSGKIKEQLEVAVPKKRKKRTKKVSE